MADKKFKLLLIDDDPDIRMLLVNHLTTIGYEVDSVEDGLEGLSIIRKNHYDIVISDINMPNLDGIELLKRSKAIEPDLEYIMITAYGDEDIAVKCLNNGAYSYLKKPISVRELNIKIKQCLEKRELIYDRNILRVLRGLINNLEHNINNPLQIVRGNIELLSRKMSKTVDPKDEIISVILANIDRISFHLGKIKSASDIKIVQSPAGDSISTDTYL